MKIRIGVGTGGAPPTPEALAELSTGLVDLGFDSLWLSEVLTGPVLDPIVGLAWAAATHPRLKVGTTMLLPGRNVVRLAKQLASLDVLSQGRLLVTLVPGLTYAPERDAIDAGARRVRVIPPHDDDVALVQQERAPQAFRAAHRGRLLGEPQRASARERERAD